MVCQMGFGGTISFCLDFPQVGRLLRIALMAAVELLLLRTVRQLQYTLKRGAADREDVVFPWGAGKMGYQHWRELASGPKERPAGRSLKSPFDC
uniref:Uncharacterized protein n=1 Tax=Rhodopseudomonas palustris (strain BisA53) TaxID=316055 RepID=Q07SM5_RHOP5